MNDELEIILEDDDCLDIHLSEEDEPLDIDLSEKISIIPIVGAPHSKLAELDYELSGHTGFMPGRISLLPEISSLKQNNNISLLVIDNEDNKGSLLISDLSNRIIRQVDESETLPDDLQEGQYVYLTKEEEIQNG